MISRSNNINATSVSHCAVCMNEHSRQHCPVCGAQRVFYCAPAGKLSCEAFPGGIADIRMRDYTTGRDLVAAYRSDLAFSVVR